jgi:tetratricopeptide (TPR) repeat protein
VSLKAEAEYNIGLSHTWLGEHDKAMAVFNRMLDIYKDDPNAVGYAQYCIAWVEIQNGKYKEAIARLERSVIAGNITDRELAARTLYLEGRTYLMFLDNPTNASALFQKIRSVYPDTRIGKYRYISGNMN